MAFNIELYAYAIIGHTRGRSTPTTAFDRALGWILCLYNVDTFNIYMEEFDLEKIIFDKMTAVRT